MKAAIHAFPLGKAPVSRGGTDASVQPKRRAELLGTGDHRAAGISTAASAICGGSPVLDRIVERSLELAVWQRPRPSGFAWLDELAWDGIGDLDFPAASEALDADVAGQLAHAGYPNDAGGAALRDEIVALARRLIAIIGCGTVRLRLEVVETDSCRRFHSDLVTVRLLTTLVGPGTQWIEAAAPDRIHQLARGDVALFKGRCWAEEPAILHRSPPIAGTGDTRLLLAIDPLDDAGEAWRG